MKKRLLFFSLFSCLLLFAARGEMRDGQADARAIIEEGEVRFTVLTPRVIRMEWDSLRQFTDDRSFVVVNRHLPVPDFEKKIKGGKLIIRTDELELTYRLNSGKF